jgi:hypothetical protein
MSCTGHQPMNTMSVMSRHILLLNVSYPPQTHEQVHVSPTLTQGQIASSLASCSLSSGLSEGTCMHQVDAEQQCLSMSRLEHQQCTSHMCTDGYHCSPLFVKRAAENVQPAASSSVLALELTVKLLSPLSPPRPALHPTLVWGDHPHPSLLNRPSFLFGDYVTPICHCPLPCTPGWDLCQPHSLLLAPCPLPSSPRLPHQPPLHCVTPLCHCALPCTPFKLCHPAHPTALSPAPPTPPGCLSYIVCILN